MADYLGQLNQERKSDQSDGNEPKSKPGSPSAGPSKISFIEFIMVLSLAVLKDLLDWLLVFVFGLGLILSRISTLLLAGLLSFWCIARLKKFPTTKFLGSFAIEMIPFLGDFMPTWTIFVVSVYLEQKGFTLEKIIPLAKIK